VEKLVPIQYDEKLTEFNLEENKNCDDRIETLLILHDYDWMNYKFITILPTKKQGYLKVEIEYFGTSTSIMKVWQTINEKVYIHEIDFDAYIFIDFVKDYMTKHIQNWEDTYAFCGEKEAIEIFNKILNNVKNYKLVEDSDD